MDDKKQGFVISEKLKRIESAYFPFSGLDEKNGITAATSLKPWGTMSPRAERETGGAQNRSRWVTALGVNQETLICPEQVHSDRVLIVGEKMISLKSGCLSGVDALVTKSKDVSLSVLTADCLAVFLWSPKSEIIGIVHAGWRGTEKRIVERTLDVIASVEGGIPPDLWVGFGPCLGRCCYEVGKEFLKIFPEAVEDRGGKLFFDLTLVNKRQILNKGVPENRIIDAGWCTGCRNDMCYSFRREKDDAGRMMSLIAMRGK